MEDEENEHARRHAQLKSVVEAKMKEAAELRGRLYDIALALECGCCLESLRQGVTRSAQRRAYLLQQGYFCFSFGRHS
jgi:hypothetical protein